MYAMISVRALSMAKTLGVFVDTTDVVSELVQLYLCQGAKMVKLKVLFLCVSNRLSDIV